MRLLEIIAAKKETLKPQKGKGKTVFSSSPSNVVNIMDTLCASASSCAWRF
jgi:non-homologous end joining protein Ku